jgi:hypothetical protein
VNSGEFETLEDLSCLRKTFVNAYDMRELEFLDHSTKTLSNRGRSHRRKKKQKKE